MPVKSILSKASFHSYSKQKYSEGRGYLSAENRKLIVVKVL
jgi:hypothetical protein